MESFATLALVVIALVAFNNYRAGTLGGWLRSKVFNTAAPRPAGPTLADASLAGAIGQSDVVLTGLGGGQGVLLSPVSGPITSGFGAPRPGGRRHAGVDFAVPAGTPVQAARAGRVTYAGGSGGYGLRVDLDHGDGVSTRYAHLSKISLRLGQVVPAGATIGASGNTGESSGPHLHFELRERGQAVNPSSRFGTSTPTAVLA